MQVMSVWLVGLALNSACAATTARKPIASATGNAPKNTMDSSTPILTNLGSGQWSIQVTRTFKTVSQDGEVSIRAADEAAAKASTHISLAGARAWSGLASNFIAQNAAPDSVACLQSGLKELGNDYALPLDTDDTSLKLAAIEDEIEKGITVDTASAMQRILDSRIAMYAKTHADQIVK